MKTPLAFLALALSVTAHAAPSQQPTFEALSKRAGTYELVSQDEKHPCGSMFQLKAGEPIEVRVFRQDAANDFFQAGDIIVELEHQVDGSTLHVFDRAPFHAVNQGTRRSLVGAMVISHQSLFDAGKQLLTHTVTSTTVTGGEQALQSVQFGNEGFTYDYTIYERNALGFTTETIPADHCEFRKVR